MDERPKVIVFDVSGAQLTRPLEVDLDDAPVWKPGAYQCAAQRCRVEPSEMMLVAVHPWDIHRGARAGLSTAWLNRGNQSHPSYFARAELVVASVTDLARRLA